MPKKKMTKKPKASTKVERDVAVRRHLSRSKRSRCPDEYEFSNIIKREPDIDWMRHPEKSDVLGIDVPTRVNRKTKRLELNYNKIFKCSNPIDGPKVVCFDDTDCKVVSPPYAGTQEGPYKIISKKKARKR